MAMKTMKAAIGALVILSAVMVSPSALAGRGGGGHGGHGGFHHGGHSHVGVGVFVGGGFWGWPYYGYGWPYYGYPYYAGYPAYYPYAAGEALTYVEQGDAQVAPPAPAQANWWYYCADSQSYYPYVKECPSAWQRVPPRPPS